MVFIFYNPNPLGRLNAGDWRGCCETITVRNTSNQPILVQNANIIFSRPDLVVSR